MDRSTNRLTVAQIRAITDPGMYPDGGTLYLHVNQNGAKSWIQRISVNGRRRDIGLGGFPLVKLAEAREKAFENRRTARSGGDPLAEKRKAKIPTFQEAAQQTYEANKLHWGNAKVRRNWIQQLQLHALPRLGTIPVDQIDQPDVLAILKPLAEKPYTAKRVRQIVRSTLDWCYAHKYVQQNVAGEAIKGGLASVKRPEKRKNHRALPYKEIPKAMEAVDASAASPAVKLSFRFLVLTGARSGETRGALWSEIDLQAREWRIPAEKMKGSREHRQPLNEPAMAVLEQARSLADGSGLIFPSPYRKRQGKPLSEPVLNALLQRVGLGDRTVVHGFRSTFRTWADECTQADHAVKELSLAHTIGSQVERAYARSDLFQKRRELMAKWGAYVTGSPE